MTIEERNKEVIRGLLAAADRGDVDRVLSYYALDYVDHDARLARSGDGSDRDALRNAFDGFAAAFPDARHELLDLVAEGDRVVARIAAEGTHTREGLGIPPTGRRVRNDSIAIYRLEEGRIVERWCRERESVLEQLDAVASPSP